jgi:hypothetical protein
MSYNQQLVFCPDRPKLEQDVAQLIDAATRYLSSARKRWNHRGIKAVTAFSDTLQRFLMGPDCRVDVFPAVLALHQDVFCEGLERKKFFIPVLKEIIKRHPRVAEMCKTWPLDHELFIPTRHW